MLKRKIIKKIIISSSAMFALFLIYIFPKDTKLNVKEELEYISSEVKTIPLFLLNDDNLIGMTKVVINSDILLDKAHEVIDILIHDGIGESLIPSGFKTVIPSETEVLDLSLDQDILNVNFNKELLNVIEQFELPIIESLVYSLTEIEGINNVVLKVDGIPLTRLPKSSVIIPNILNRSIGINKEYDISSLSNIKGVTTYYIDKYNDNYYYVPVTKYVNDERDNIRIIIQNLSSSNTINNNLMSFLNSKTKLLDYKQVNDTLELTFNNYIFNNIEQTEILEEVIYTICLSIKDSYNVNQVSFNVGDQEIYKQVIKNS